jgi:predicted ester cyclase
MKRIHLGMTLVMMLLFPAMSVLQPLLAAPDVDGSPADNKATILLLVQEAYNRGNSSIINTIYDPNYQGLLSESNPSGTSNRTDVSTLIAQYRQAFSNFNATVDMMVAEDDWVASRITLRGTFNRGTYYGIQPTGEPIEIALHTFHRFNAQGQIIEELITWDNLAFSIQLGLLDSQDAEAAG